MRTASSASRTWRALASASEYTATVATPSRLAVLMTRHAISPRFAIRIFLNIPTSQSSCAVSARSLCIRPDRATFVEEGAESLRSLGRRAGRKALALSGEHDGPNIPVRINRRERSREIGDKRLVEGVVDFGTVHPDPGGRSAELQPQCLIGHGHSHIRKTPNFVEGIGAFKAVAKERPSTLRAWAGSTTPSSHIRAVA